MAPFDPELFRPALKGNKFEDFKIGDVFVHHWGRTLTSADNMIFCTATCTWSPMYMNAEYARHHQHCDVVINPMLVLCVTVGLSVEDLSEAGGVFLGVDDCTFHRPVYPGDTINARSAVVGSRLSRSRPNDGIVTWHSKAFNQHDSLVLEFRRTNLVGRRNEA